MTKEKAEAYEGPENLKKIIETLKGRKFRLDCGHHVTFGHFLGNSHHDLQRQASDNHLLAMRLLKPANGHTSINGSPMPEGHFFERRKVMDLSQYLKAGYPGLYIETHEPLRAIATIGTATWKSFSWDCLRGIAERETGRVTEDILDPLGAIKWLGGQSETVLFVQNFHHFFASVEIIQGIQNSIPSWKASGCCLVMVGPPVRIPPEISSFFTILDFRLPSRDELRLIQQELGKSVGVEADEDSIDAALGLTEFESETAFALSLVQEKKFSSTGDHRAEDADDPPDGTDGVLASGPGGDGGRSRSFEAVPAEPKKGLRARGRASSAPRALLLVGIPGTGKSLSCKAAASIFGWPLIRLDISALKDSLVGESERKIRQATATIEAFGKAVVWLDEIDKAFAGVKSSGKTDGGTTSAMFGHFLTWMQETTSPVLVMATANNIRELPPEFLRAGTLRRPVFRRPPECHRTAGDHPDHEPQIQDLYPGRPVRQTQRLDRRGDRATGKGQPLRRPGRGDGYHRTAFPDHERGDRGPSAVGSHPRQEGELGGRNGNQKHKEDQRMSHISKIELQVNDLSILGSACSRLGLELIRSKTSFKWYGKDAPCAHAIRVPQADYEIGVIDRDGGYRAQLRFL